MVPYVVTKKTVFKWQEGFWKVMKDVFDADYKQKYIQTGLIPDGNLQHLISDAATMQIIRWTKGTSHLFNIHHHHTLSTHPIKVPLITLSITLTNPLFVCVFVCVRRVWHGGP